MIPCRRCGSAAHVSQIFHIASSQLRSTIGPGVQASEEPQCDHIEQLGQTIDAEAPPLLPHKTPTILPDGIPHIEGTTQ